MASGGGLALPIWIGYMQKALPSLPSVERETPSGITTAGGDYVYTEYSESGGIGSLGLTPPSESKPPTEKTEEGQKSELF